jgi:hypothetical protein
MTHAEIITEKGTAEIAEKCGVSPAHVRVWKNRGIPRAAYAEIMDAFPDVTLAMLKAGETKAVAA